MVYFVVPLITPILDFVWLSQWILKPGWFSQLNSYLVISRVVTGDTLAFYTVLVVYMCTTGLSSGHPSC